METENKTPAELRATIKDCQTLIDGAASKVEADRWAKWRDHYQTELDEKEGTQP